MGQSAAEVLVDTIYDWGVEVVFGLPGDRINGIMEALRKRKDEIRFVLIDVPHGAGISRRLPRHDSRGCARLPGEADLRHAAHLLNAGKKVVILAGQGAPRHRRARASRRDSRGPYRQATARRAVQIELDPMRVGLRCPVEVGLVGDSRRTLEALLPMLERKQDRSFLDRAQKGMKDWWALMEERGTRRDSPMKPQVVAWELGQRLRDDAIVSCDSGTIATWWARQIPAHRQMHSLSGNLATSASPSSVTAGSRCSWPSSPSASSTSCR